MDSSSKEEGTEDCDDEDDDFHFCLLCRNKIRGLESYVRHRKEKMCKSTADPPPPQAEEGQHQLQRNEDDFASVVSADDFFQYFQLQHNTAAAAVKSTENTENKDGRGGDDKQEGDRVRRPSADMLDTLGLYLKEPVPEQSNFMRQIDLMSVAQQPNPSSSSTGGVGKQWKLWNPEQEDDLAWADDVVLENNSGGAVNSAGDFCLDTVCNDPTLMEAESSAAIYQVQQQSSHRERSRTTSGLLSTTFPSPSLSSERQARKRTPNKKYVDDTADDSNIEVSASSSSSDAVITCQSCHARVARWQYGKHLISHFHHHRSRLPRNHPVSRKLVLEHISEIVRLAPFRCEPCRFYCNWDGDFVDHWKSATHAENAREEEGHVFWCSFCNVRCAGNGEMLGHLRGDRHGEIVVAIGRHVPIVVKKMELSGCRVCGKLFRLRFSLERHLRRSHSDIYEDEKAIISTENSAEEHKSDTAAAVVVVSDVKCDVYSADEATSDASQCGICGDRFALSQDLGAHVRRRECRLPPASMGGPFSCGECNYGCGSVNRLLFHQGLCHSISDDDQRDTVRCYVCSKILGSRSRLWDHVRIHGDCHRCRECYRIFGSKAALACHAKSSHLKNEMERTAVFCCDKCDYRTSKRTLLALHERRNHERRRCHRCGKETRSAAAHREHLRLVHRSGGHGCDQCSHVAATAYDLKRHRVCHEEARRLECAECQFVCKRTSEMARHARTKHGGGGGRSKEVRHKCDACEYSTPSRQHLSRHRRSRHGGGGDGGGSLQCRLCDHRSATMENLRKHILKTSVHPGAAVYSCQRDGFGTDSAMEFAGHLAVGHADEFPTAVDARRSVRNYFAAAAAAVEETKQVPGKNSSVGASASSFSRNVHE